MGKDIEKGLRRMRSPEESSVRPAQKGQKGVLLLGGEGGYAARQLIFRRLFFSEKIRKRDAESRTNGAQGGELRLGVTRVHIIQGGLRKFRFHSKVIDRPPAFLPERIYPFQNVHISVLPLFTISYS